MVKAVSICRTQQLTAVIACSCNGNDALPVDQRATNLAHGGVAENNFFYASYPSFPRERIFAATCSSV